MQLLTMFEQMIESGKIILSTKDQEDVVIVATNKRIDINAKNKEFIKDILASIREVVTVQDLLRVQKKA
jgi:hypothetical protein